MIHIVDLNAYGSFHLLYNVSMVKIWLAIVEGPITLYVQESHWKQLNGYFTVSERERIAYKFTHVKNENTSKLAKTFSIGKKAYQDFFEFRRILNEANKNPKDIVFLCTAHSLSFLLFHYLKKRYPNVPVISTLHGEIEFVYFAQNKWEADTGNLYKRMFKLRPKNLYYLFLNKISKNQFVKDQYITASQAFEIDHPYVYHNSDSPTVSFNHDKLIIAHVGSMGVRKSSHLLYQLAENNRQLIENDLIDFWTIGPVEADASPYKSSFVKDFTNSDGSTYIPRSLFENKVKQIDYAVFFYNSEQFIFRASGAVHDVLNFNKPLIVLNHPYFLYLFQQAGNIGFICNDLEEMSILLRDLVLRKPEYINQYDEQCLNIIAYKKRNNIQSISIDLKNQINTLL